MARISILISLALLLVAPMAHAGGYSLDPSRLSIRWIAYKTPAKAPVGGTFKTLTPTGKTEGATLAELFTGATVTIDAMSVDTGNPGRDENLMSAFFGLLAGKEIKASVEGLYGEGEKGGVTLSVTMNGVTRSVPMAYTLADGRFHAEGHIDLFDFSLGGALSSINKKCAALHKKKTWNDVNIILSVPVVKK